jgi:hypothetical protein
MAITAAALRMQTDFPTEIRITRGHSNRPQAWRARSKRSISRVTFVEIVLVHFWFDYEQEHEYEQEKR